MCVRKDIHKNVYFSSNSKAIQTISTVEWMSILLLPHIEICTTVTIFTTMTVQQYLVYKSHKHNIMFSRKKGIHKNIFCMILFL